VSTPDSLQILAGAGAPVNAMPEAQRDVLRGLSTEEAETLAGIMTKLSEAADDVQGHSLDGPGLF
jgi:hypothetical protein